MLDEMFFQENHYSPLLICNSYLRPTHSYLLNNILDVPTDRKYGGVGEAHGEEIVSCSSIA